MHRITGFTEVLLGTRWTPEEGSRRPVATQLVPAVELTKITGNAKIDKIFGTFNGRIYNGSGWTLNELTVNVTALKPGGPSSKWGRLDLQELITAWTREFRIPDLDVPPLEVREFSVQVTGAEEAFETKWSIVAARGHR